jgi:Ser/Thr protein kinase RdoA (MazF antagonist)
MAYTELDEATQIAEVEKLVPELLARYGLAADHVENVNHSYNSSFKVISGDQAYALRINLGSDKSSAEVLAEMQWLEALAGVIPAPVPVRTTSGELFTSIYFPPLEGEFNAVVFKWIDGDEVGDNATTDQIFAIGENMAKLQIFAENLKFEAPAFLPEINKTLLQSEDLLRPNQPSQVDDELYELLLKGFELSDEVHQRLSQTQTLIPIHADLHAANIIQTKNGIAVIDFDDAGIGLPIQDLSISAFYLRKDKEQEKIVAEGYSSIKELPSISAEDFEVLVMARGLLLTNAILSMTSAEIVEFTPTYMQRIKVRLRNFFDTGEFMLSV